MSIVWCKTFHRLKNPSLRTTIARDVGGTEILTTAPLYSGFPSMYRMFCIRVFAMSTGIDAAVVTSPEIILATK